MKISKMNFAWILFLLPVVAFSGMSDSLEDDYFAPKRQGGFVFTLAETGTGIGGFMAWPFLDDWHLGVGLDAYFLRDSKEVTYYDYVYQVPITRNKQNNVYMFDFMVSVKKRFFADDLDHSMRPFLTSGVGPFYGMNYPELAYSDQGIPLKDEFRWALGGFFGSGVDVSMSGRYFLGFRAQYKIIPFAEKLGERTNHSMFEIRIEVGQRF